MKMSFVCPLLALVLLSVSTTAITNKKGWFPAWIFLVEDSPASPVTQTRSPVSPVTQTISPVSPVTQTRSPASPVTQTISPASPVTQTRFPASPVTQTISPASPVTQTGSPASPITKTATPPIVNISSVVFTARLTNDASMVPDVEGGKVKFDRVLTNEGSGYNPATGHFTAPVTGFYAFFVELTTSQNAGFQWGLVSDSIGVLCTNTLAGSPNYDKATCIATTKLIAGQNVYVTRQGGWSGTAHGNNACSFDGFLL